MRVIKYQVHLDPHDGNGKLILEETADRSRAMAYAYSLIAKTRRAHVYVLAIVRVSNCRLAGSAIVAQLFSR